MRLLRNLFRKKDAEPAPADTEVDEIERRLHRLANGMLHRIGMVQRSKDAKERIKKGYDIPGDNNRASPAYRQIAQEEYDEMRAEYEELERRMGELKRERMTLI